MKKIIIALAVLSATVPAETEFNTVKSFDGKAVHCKTIHDLYRNKTGLYLAKATAATIEDQRISFKINLSFLACVKEEERFKFVYKGPYEKFQYSTVLVEDMMVAQAKEVKLKAYKDGVYKILTSQIIEDDSKQVQTITVDLKDVLNAGNKKRGSIDFWVVKKMNFSIEGQGVDFDEMINYGSYRINFNIVNTEEGLKVNLL